MYRRRQPGISLEAARRVVWVRVDGRVCSIAYTGRLYIVRDGEGCFIALFDASERALYDGAWDVERLIEFVRGMK